MSPDDHARRSRDLEVACDFAGAAKEALLADDPGRAALLASLAGDKATIDAATEKIATLLDGKLALRIAGDLAARGFNAPAGRVFSRIGEHAKAGESFAAAGEACASAESYERAGRPADGARVLEAALRARPTDEASRLALGRLLARHGRTEAAVKALQQLDPRAPERKASLPLLKRCLAELGLEDASRTLAEEMEKLGVVDEAPSEEAAPPPSSHATGALLFGRYQTVRDVVHTPHARVVEAIDRIGGEHVAVKLFATVSADSGRDALLRFEREANALAQLRHPNVVPLRAYLPDGPAIVVAWMAGGSLVDLLAGDPMTPARSVEIAKAVLGALGEAHRLGILHRDVKPSNVLFDDAGTARLSDFGAAHLGDLSSTATAGAIGTFAYMSPEQRLGKPASLASDLYGVGVLLAELLTGTPAGPSSNGHFTPMPSACHPELTAVHDAIVAKLLDEDPARRPADAFEARRLLGSVIWPARAVPRPARPPRHVSERPPAGEQRLLPSIEPATADQPGERFHDAWLGRDVVILASDEAALATARGFARAGHPVLPTVLRVDAIASSIWIAPPRGRSLAEEPRALSQGQLARLAEAIRSLHEAGGAHGALDTKHIHLDDGEINVSYPSTAGALDEARASDTAALASMGAS